MRASLASGGVGGTWSSVSLWVVQESAVAPTGAPAASQLSWLPGFLAPACDRAGLLGAWRLARMILGAEPILDTLVTYWAGTNGDGLLDVGDVVHCVNRSLP